jgi:rRNA-processing protein FCF1
LEREQLFEVICDTNFLIHLSTRRIKNIDSANSEIGDFQYVVPLVVLNELQRLSTIPDKEQDARKTLEFVRNLKTIPISGRYADDAITEHVKKHGGVVATIDKDLKSRIKNSGGSVMSLSNDKIVLEP